MKPLGHLIDGVAESAPGSTALIIGAERRPITYAQLAELVVDHCAALMRRGLRPGDVVAIEATNRIEFVIALLGAARAGIVVAPLDPALPDGDRRARAGRVGARAILTVAGDADVKPEIRLLATDSAGVGSASVLGLTDRDALIMFTSGTTGTPKLVPWTHDNIAASIDGVANAYQLSAADATVAVMPLFHGHGLIATLLATLATGGAVVLPANGRFSAHTFADDVAAAPATWYTAVPTIHQILLDRAPEHGRQGRLRFIRSCSAPLSTTLVKRIEAAFGAPVLSAYGMTETTHQASTVRPCDGDRARLHTVGTTNGLSVRIVDGEIWLRGPGVVRGYLGDTAATAATFVDGWVRTGDLGAIDADGRIEVAGRIKEQINRGGEKISPEHVEEVLLGHPDVVQAAVFGVADVLYGERVEAIVVRHSGSQIEAAELKSFARQRLAAFEVPEQITFADQLPLTAKGSVDRAQLARQAGAGHAVPTA